MLEKPKIFAIATVVLMASTLVITVPAQQSADDRAVEPTAGFFGYTGGPVRGKIARTQTASWSLAEAATWTTLPGAAITYTVPTGATDLVNIAFSAECRL